MKKKMTVRIPLAIEVDVDAWETAYGTTNRKDIVDHVTNTVIEGVKAIPVMEEWTAVVKLNRK